MDDSIWNQINQASSNIASAAATIVSGYDSFRGRQFVRDMYKRQRKDALADIQDAREWATMQWDKQNTYNAPVNQLARMQEAGINPNNAAAAIAGVSASAPVPNPITPNNVSPSSPSFGSADGLIASANLLKELSKNEAEIENLKADTAKKDAETQHTYISANQVAEELVGLVYDNNVLKPRQAKEIEAVINKTLADKNLSEAEHDESIERTKKLGEDILNLQKQREELQESINLMKKQEQTEDTKQALNEAEKQLTDLNGEYQKLINGYEADLQQIGTSTKASQNPAINAVDRAGVITRKGLGVSQSYDSKGNPVSINPRNTPAHKTIKFVKGKWHSYKEGVKARFRADFGKTTPYPNGSK